MPAATKALKPASREDGLPEWFGSVSKAIKAHSTLGGYHDQARELAVKLGASRKTMEKLLEAVETHRRKTLGESLKMLKQQGFKVKGGGEEGYAELMAEIERADSERFRLISACWALEHGLQKASKANATILSRPLAKAKSSKTLAI